MRLGWRSWLAALPLLLWLLPAAVLAWSSWATAATMLAITLAATLTVAAVGLPMALLWAVLRPARVPTLPAGPRFERSRAWLVVATAIASFYAALGIVIIPLAMLGLGASLPDLLGRRDWLPAALIVLSLPGCAILPPLALWRYWRDIIGSWRRRRAPFAVIGRDQLWIDGIAIAPRDMADPTLNATRLGDWLGLRHGGQRRAIPLFAMAGPSAALHAAIVATGAAARPAGEGEGCPTDRGPIMVEP